MGVSVTAALLVCVLARSAPVFGLTVEPSELDALGPVDSAEKNRADELSTAEPIDYGGNTEDTGPHTFGPPVKDAFDYGDYEAEDGDNETENGEEDIESDPPWGLDVEDEGEDESRAFPVTDTRNRNGSDTNGNGVNVQSANKTGNGSRISGYGIYGVRESESEGDVIGNETLTTENKHKNGSADSSRGRKNRLTGSVSGRKKLKVSRNRNETSAARNGTETKSRVSRTGNKFGAKINGTEKKSRVSRQGNGSNKNGPQLWNGYKTYVNVNRTKHVLNTNGDTGDSIVNINENTNSSDRNETGNETTGNASENSEVKAHVEEVPLNTTSKVTKAELGKSDFHSTNSNEWLEPTERSETSPTVDYAMTGEVNARSTLRRMQPRKKGDEPVVNAPKPGQQAQAESTKRSYNYDETQVPSPSGDVQEIITYDYGDIKEIIIPENPTPVPLPSSGTLRYGLHPNTNPYNHNRQPYLNPESNTGYPQYHPEVRSNPSTYPYNPDPTVSYYNPPESSPYPSSTDYGQHSPSSHLKSNFDYAPNYSQNSTPDYSTYRSAPRPNAMQNPRFNANVPKNSMSSHQMKDHVTDSQYNSEFDNYAPHYDSSTKPEFEHSGPSSGAPPDPMFTPETNPYYKQGKSGPVYEFYGTPNSKTWVSYESIPIKNPSTDAGPPIVEIIYHRENGVVYEDDIIDDVTTSQPEVMPKLTSTSGYFPTTGNIPTYADENFQSNHERPKNQKSNFRPKPGPSNGPRRKPSGDVRPGTKAPVVGAHNKKPGRSRLPPANSDFKDEDFPDDEFPEVPGTTDSPEEPKKKLDSRQKNTGSKSRTRSKNGNKNRTIDSEDNGFPKLSSFDFEDSGPLKKLNNADLNAGDGDFQKTKIPGFNADVDKPHKPPRIPDFGTDNKDLFPPKTETADFNEEFPAPPKITDFDTDDDAFPNRNLGDFDQVKKVVDEIPTKAKVTDLSDDPEWRQKKVTHFDTVEPSSERQKKKKAEKSESGEKHDSGHKKEEGKKGEKGVKSEHKFSEGEKVQKNEAKETEGVSKKGSKKKATKDDGGYYAEKHKGEKGEKGGKFHDEEEHVKGHSTKGKHEIHKKDEFSRKHSFFDEHHEGGKHEKHGGYEAAEEIEKGGEFHEGHKKESHKVGHKGKKGRLKEGKHYHEDKGAEDAAGKDEKESHDEEYGKEEKKEKKEKKEFEL